MNAKGKRLAHIDLIKNKLFELLNKVEPADFADESWKKLKSILCSGKESVGLATFYQHYWSSSIRRYILINSVKNKFFTRQICAYAQIRRFWQEWRFI